MVSLLSSSTPTSSTSTQEKAALKQAIIIKASKRACEPLGGIISALSGDSTS